MLKIRRIDLTLLLAFLVLSIGINVAIHYYVPVALATALFSIVPVTIALGILIFLRRHGRESDLKMRQSDWQQIEALFNIYSLIKPTLPIPKFRIGAASPDILEVICKEILVQKPECVVECGAGASTIVAGYLLKGLKRGHLVSIEHDRNWAERVNSWISEHNLDEFVTLIEAPLVQHKVHDRMMKWYEMSRIKQELDIRRPINLLFVDGPPFWIQSCARFPAIPILSKFLSKDCVIIVDDANRVDDHKVVLQWLDSMDYKPEWVETEKGAVILRRSKESVG